MRILGIESSCDECAASVVEDGKTIISNVVATQIDFHKPYNGVVPEIASRLHLEWISSVVKEALVKANMQACELDGVAVTSRPGLMGSLLVGLSFAKAFSWSLAIPFVTVDHIKAHLYAAHLEQDISYPYIGLLVSGGHTIICKVEAFDQIHIMGTTIDDAVGEAFDKVAKFYNLGYPGGVCIDKLSKEGDMDFFDFPSPNLHKGEHPYDVSYSGLKNAVLHQTHLFKAKGGDYTVADIVASFQKRAISILLKRLFKATADTGIYKVVAGGGVAANSYLRSELAKKSDLQVIFPSLSLCTDNGAMIGGIGFHYLKQGCDELDVTASPRVTGFKKNYP